ncbi:low-density lipoprotein receptor-like [Centropristis striata]|uniref:low-density lipoprotein receptor-like n=1 Tax=Centropristis striata TaxID=184440 RepID=UPI0027E162E2|nr:low-density lipoprotein receptor-like [Centropristis striata]
MCWLYPTDYRQQRLRHISAPRALQLWRTSSMGHLGALFLLLVPLTCCQIWGAAGHSLPSCSDQQEFRCSDGSCISRLNVCDGHKDCEDGSDEQHCGHLSCQNDEFSCRSRRCISIRFCCNGVDDCGDGSDEAPDVCGSSPSVQTSSKCSSSEFECGDGECIRQSWRCDHSQECSDGSDEENCDQNECEVNNGGCSHVCVDQLMGFHCDCPDNMKLVGDSYCEEVDSCLERDVCDQLCSHRNGSFACDCHQDYLMDPSSGECRAKGEEAQLVFSSSKGIRSISITGAEYRTPPPHLAGPGPLAALASNRTLYWAPGGRGAVYRVSVDGKLQDSVLVLEVAGSVSGLAVDWIHHLLYWTSVENGSVSVGLLDGSAHRRLITGLDEPSAVAVEPLHGLLFWAQRGGSPKIERSRLDGGDTKTLVTSSIRHPVALSLDMPRQLLYWVDEGTRSISRVNLDGRQRKIVVESNGYLDRPFGLAVFEGFVYWSEEVTRSVCRASKHDGNNLQILLSNVSSPGGVVVLQPVLQPDGPTVCGHSRTPCNHKCVVDLLSESPQFSCTPPEKGQSKPEEIPSISRTVPAPSLPDPTFAGILSLIMFLSVLLVGVALWWWREEFRPSRSLTEQSFSLKESQDPLIVQGPHTCPVKETLLKLDLEGE